MACSLPSLRQVAPRLARHLFQRPRQCSNPLKARPVISSSLLLKSRGLRCLKTSTKHNAAATGDIWATVSPPKAPDAPALGRLTKAGKAKAHKYFFPELSEKPVAYWLLGSAASVFGLVVFGGLTRLTESGYVGLFSRVTMADEMKSEHYRMETGHWKSAPFRSSAVGVGVCKVPSISRICPPEPEHDDG